MMVVDKGRSGRRVLEGQVRVVVNVSSFRNSRGLLHSSHFLADFLSHKLGPARFLGSSN